jgi:hypothetical protein
MAWYEVVHTGDSHFELCQKPDNTRNTGNREVKYVQTGVVHVGVPVQVPSIVYGGVGPVLVHGGSIGPVLIRRW